MKETDAERAERLAELAARREAKHLAELAEAQAAADRAFNAPTLADRIAAQPPRACYATPTQPDGIAHYTKARARIAQGITRPRSCGRGDAPAPTLQIQSGQVAGHYLLAGARAGLLAYAARRA